MHRMKRMAFLLVAGIVLSHAPGIANAACSGRFIDPIADINWKNLFPIRIGGYVVAKAPPSLPDTRRDSGKKLLCHCPLSVPPYVRIGIPIAFWEPLRLGEVVRKPLCFPSLGGLDLGSSIGMTLPHGARKADKDGGKASFYHVHWLANPLLFILNIITDVVCLQKESFDILYVTELDPLWSDDELAVILNPEALLFGNPIAQAACAADCAAATADLPLNPLFWCAGCQGGLYPFTGTVTDHVGGVMASLLLVERFQAKMHRELLADFSSARVGQCQPYPFPIVVKDQYRYQLVLPIRQSTVPSLPFGRTETIVSPGKEFPVKGEDFVWQSWRKRDCCAF